MAPQYSFFLLKVPTKVTSDPTHLLEAVQGLLKSGRKRTSYGSCELFPVSHLLDESYHAGRSR